MNRIFAIVGVIIVVGLGALWWLSGQSSAPGLDLPAAANAQDSDVDLSLAPDMSLGNPDADVTVIEYASFTCPHCASFHAGTFKQLKADYIDTGKINFVHREVYFDKFGLWAGLLARCGETPERYFAIADLIYTQQRTWTQAANDAGVANNLMQMGRTVGMSDERLNGCLQDQDRAQAMIASYQQNATADGVRATPSFVINGTLHSNMSYADFQRILAEAGVE